MNAGPSVPHDRRLRLRADLLLLTAAMIWGAGFTSQRLAARHLETATFNAVRFLVAAVALLPFLLLRRRERQEHHLTGWRLVAGGAAVGLAMTVGSWFQQAGVEKTTAGKAGFITGLYVILVPIFARFGGHRPPATTWPAALLAVTGLFLLSVNVDWMLGRGDLLVLASAFVWAIHVLLIGWLAPRMDGVLLAWLQVAFTALLSAPSAWLHEHATIADFQAAAWPVLYNGIVCGALGFTLQIAGQRHAPPADAAILMSLESVFAALFGALVLAEHLGGRALLGAALMLLATLVSQWPALKPRRNGPASG